MTSLMINHQSCSAPYGQLTAASGTYFLTHRNMVWIKIHLMIDSALYVYGASFIDSTSPCMQCKRQIDELSMFLSETM